MGSTHAFEVWSEIGDSSRRIGTYPTLVLARDAAAYLSRRTAGAVTVRSVRVEWSVVAQYESGRRVGFGASVPT